MNVSTCHSCKAAAESVLYEPEGYTQETNYEFVGRGKGDFKPASYEFAGQGQGNYAKETLPQRPGCCWYICPFLFVLILGGLACVGALWYTERDHECSSGDPLQWPSQRRAWCCVTTSTGCPGNIQFMEHECQPSASNAVSRWSHDKKDYCCQHFNHGCPAAAAAAAASPATHSHGKTQVTHNCSETEHHPARSWGKEKKQWCCFHHGVACPPSTAHPYDCDAGFSEWRTAWPFSKKKWCCDHTGRGCSEDESTTPKPDGCKKVCSLGGQSSTCAEHMRWAAKNYKFESYACVSAYTLVVAQCSSCSDCTLAEVDCEVEDPSKDYDCKHQFEDWESKWSQSKKEWCCKVVGRGCGPDGTPKPLAYDCDKDFSHWEKRWTRDKMIWCCQYAGRGCMTTTVAVAG